MNTELQNSGQPPHPSTTKDNVVSDELTQDPRAHGLRDGPFRDESAQQRQEYLSQQRAKRAEERSRAKLDAWKEFMQAERRELEQRKAGQLATLLGAPLPGESPAVLQHLAFEDRRQAQEGLVALMSNGKMSYKRLEELSEGDMPTRIAASRLRTTWLKKRGDGWLGRGDDHL
jgi:hypothetical protein